MPIYKNNIKYDFGYQVDTDCNCDAHPNTLENIGEQGRAALFDVDNTWLPYIKITAGECRIASRPFINCIKSLYLMSDDVPARFWSSDEMAELEQYYINNNLARWGSSGNSDNVRTLVGEEDIYRDKIPHRTFATFIDDQCTQESDMLYYLRKKTSICWTPNANVSTFSYDTTLYPDVSTVINAANLTAPLENPEDHEPRFIYLVDTLYDNLFNGKSSDWVENWNVNYDNLVEIFAADETEWLSNYFTVNPNKTEFPWYTTQLPVTYGKYVRLKYNNSTLAELPYWRLDEKFVYTEPNFTNQNATREITTTFNGETKTEQITLGPAEPTFKVRMYINTDNGNYDMFSLWPFNFAGECNDWSSDWSIIDMWDSDVLRCQAMYSLIKKIRYRYVGDSEWTDVTLPSYSDIVRGASDGTGKGRIEWYPAVQLTQDGYIDVEFYLSFNRYVPLYDKDGVTYLHLMNIARDMSWTANKVWNRKYNSNDLWQSAEGADEDNSETPWIKSFDFNKQAWEWFHLYNDNTGFFSNQIGAPTYGRYIKTAAYHDFAWMRNSDSSWLMANGWYTGVTDIVMDNLSISRHDNKNFWNTDNDGSRDYLTVWYVNPVRQPFNDWFLGVNPRPKVVYLHPTIYNMMNHGFISGCYEYEGQWTCWDDHDPEYGTVKGIPEGWNYERLQAFLNDGGEIRELPQNWKELVPDYIGK